MNRVPDRFRESVSRMGIDRLSPAVSLAPGVIAWPLAFGNLGMWEIIGLGLVALLIFGKRLPEVGRSLGRGLVEFKRGLSGIEEDLNGAGQSGSSRGEASVGPKAIESSSGSGSGSGGGTAGQASGSPEASSTPSASSGEAKPS